MLHNYTIHVIYYSITNLLVSKNRMLTRMIFESSLLLFFNITRIVMDFYFNNNSTTYVIHNLNNITANWHLINTLFLKLFNHITRNIFLYIF